jgi:hypothetical protein
LEAGFPAKGCIDILIPSKRLQQFTGGVQGPPTKRRKGFRPPSRSLLNLLRKQSYF